MSLPKEMEIGFICEHMDSNRNQMRMIKCHKPVFISNDRRLNIIAFPKVTRLFSLHLIFHQWVCSNFLSPIGLFISSWSRLLLDHYFEFKFLPTMCFTLPLLKYVIKLYFMIVETYFAKSILKCQHNVLVISYHFS